MGFWRGNRNRLFHEDLHRRDEADVGFAGAALRGGTLEDLWADGAAASGLGAVRSSASATLGFDFDGLGVGDLFLNFVGLSTFRTGIDHAGHHLVFGDFLGRVALFAFFGNDFAGSAKKAEATAGWKERGDEAEEEKRKDFFHKFSCWFGVIKKAEIRSLCRARFLESGKFLEFFEIGAWKGVFNALYYVEMRRTFLHTLSFLAFSGWVVAGDWMEWRGPNGNGSVVEGKMPMEFGKDGKNVAWKAELPGRGCSTPAVAGGQIFLSVPVDGKDALFAFGMDGKEKWRQVFGDETPGRGQRVGSGANSSPSTDGKVVVAYFKSGRVVGSRVDGEKLWEVNLQEKFGEDKLWWDQGTSPVIFGDSVILAVMQTEGNSYLASFELESGKVKWKTDRKYETQKETGDSYTTPHLVEVDGVPTLVTFGADHITGHDARSGELIWTSGGINPKNEAMWRTIASSVVTEGILVVPHGRGEWLMGVKLGGKGDVTEANHLWRKKMPGTDAATPVAHGGLVYQLVDRGKDRGLVICLDAKTGEEKWRGKLPKSPSTYYSSPILVGDTLCCPREDGVVMMAKVGPDGLGEVVANDLGESLIASPVFVDGKLLLRGDKHLWCLE